MAAFSGTAGSVIFYSGSGTVIAGIGEWSLDGSLSPVESTEFGESFDSFVSSVRNTTGSFSGNKDTSDTAHLALQTTFLNGSYVNLRLYENATKYWNLGACLITGMGNTVSVKGKGEASFSFQVSGAISYN